MRARGLNLARHHRRQVVTSLVVMALLGVTCDRGGDGEAVGAGPDAEMITTTTARPTTTTLPVTTNTAAPTPEEDVLAAYLDYWDAVDEAFSLPQVDPDSAALSQYATGEALDRVRQNADDALQASEAYRIPEGGLYEHRAVVVFLEEDSATVRDCNIDDTVAVDTSSGEVVDDAVSTRLYISMLVQEAGQWKVAAVNRESSLEGVAGCALE